MIYIKKLSKRSFFGYSCVPTCMVISRSSGGGSRRRPQSSSGDRTRSKVIGTKGAQSMVHNGSKTGSSRRRPVSSRGVRRGKTTHGNGKFQMVHSASAVQVRRCLPPSFVLSKDRTLRYPCGINILHDRGDSVFLSSDRNLACEF